MEFTLIESSEGKELRISVIRILRHDGFCRRYRRIADSALLVVSEPAKMMIDMLMLSSSLVRLGSWCLFVLLNCRAVLRKGACCSAGGEER